LISAFEEKDCELSGIVKQERGVLEFSDFEGVALTDDAVPGWTILSVHLLFDKLGCCHGVTTICSSKFFDSGGNVLLGLGLHLEGHVAFFNDGLRLFPLSEVF
tara:strand:- start:106 stop:414 length:309 start_codon:yes stop_codon:yes gene_type:complete